MRSKEVPTYIFVLLVTALALVPVVFSDPSLEVWTGTVELTANKVIDGTNSLIIDGATVHFNHYVIIVEDFGNLTVINNANLEDKVFTWTTDPSKGWYEPQGRVICRDNATVSILNSSVDSLEIYDNSNILIEKGSYIQYLTQMSSSWIKPRIADSTINVSRINVGVPDKYKYPMPQMYWKHGNFSLIGDVWKGYYKIMVMVENSTIVNQKYDIHVFGYANATIDSPTAEIDYIYVYDAARVVINNISYSFPPEAFLIDAERDAINVAVYRNGYVSISKSNFTFGGQLYAYEYSEIEVANSIIGFVHTNDYVNFTASHLNAWGCTFRVETVAEILDSSDLVQWQTAEGTYKWLGIRWIENYDKANVTLENVSVGIDVVASPTLGGKRHVKLNDNTITYIENDVLHELIVCDQATAYIVNSTINGELIVRTTYLEGEERIVYGGLFQTVLLMLVEAVALIAVLSVYYRRKAFSGIKKKRE